MVQHLRYLDECAELHGSLERSSGEGEVADPLERLCVLNPDLLLEIAKVRGAAENHDTRLRCFKECSAESARA